MPFFFVSEEVGDKVLIKGVKKNQKQLEGKTGMIAFQVKNKIYSVKVGSRAYKIDIKYLSLKPKKVTFC